MELKNAVTVAELATVLQTWAHEGHAKDKVMVKLYDGMYEIKSVTREFGNFLDCENLSFQNIFTINAEPMSNE